MHLKIPENVSFASTEYPLTWVRGVHLAKLSLAFPLPWTSWWHISVQEGSDGQLPAYRAADRPAAQAIAICCVT